MNESVDIAIVGGGMIGASLAVALQPLGLKIALIEAVPPESAAQPSFDERTTALSNGSRQVLTGMGIWPEVSHAATPILRIHVSDRGRFGFARLDAAEQGMPALGYVLANRTLGGALWARLRAHSAFRLLCPATVDGIEFTQDEAQLRVSGASVTQVNAKLLVAADGAQSSVRKALNISASEWDYRQTAVVTTVATARFHDHTAYERFTPSGPLAVLPLSDGRCTVIWTLAPERAREVLQRDDTAFLAELQDIFGFRLGRFTRAGRRFAYPLALTQAREHVGRRSVIIGNAAQGLHPIAGQGFNLGLRDVATLAEIIANAPLELGTAAMLRRYDEWRESDRRGLVAFTDGLVRLFGAPLASLSAARNLGLLLFDLAPPAKRALSRLSSGFAGRLPRLTRGAPLR